MARRSSTMLMQKALMFAVMALAIAAITGLYGDKIMRKVRNLTYDVSASAW